MIGKTGGDVARHECDNCDAYHVGPVGDLSTMGWVNHLPASPHAFLMCGDCEAKFEERRAAKASAA